MLFNSAQFLVFFPIVLFIFFLIPKKVRYIWLLIASYYFYMCWSVKYALLLLFSTGVTYISGILLENIKARSIDKSRKERLKKLCVAGSFGLNLGVLIFFKYFDFLFDNISGLLGVAGIELSRPGFNIVLPVGISFYTFQALSYTMDVYRDEIYAEKNFLRYALFVSFFPQLVAGPIERSKNLLKQLGQTQKFDFEKARDGLLLMLWGFFLKIVLADRIAIFVDAIYGDYAAKGGFYIVVATMLFAVQIYCDFYGYSTIAMGAAEILGIHLMENFNSPYLAQSVAEFWRKWHISLSSWFRDYLYFPLGGSKKGKLRKYLNIMIVFLTSGLWHGASWSFVVWGGLNGFYQIIGDILKPVRDKAVKWLQLDRNTYSHKLFHIVGTFALIDFSWIFFRAASLGDALGILRSMVSTFNPWILLDGSLYKCGLDRANFDVMLISILILLGADICKARGVKIREIIVKQEWWFRWVFVAMSAAMILLLGVWGSNYDATSFIYFQF